MGPQVYIFMVGGVRGVKGERVEVEVEKSLRGGGGEGGGRERGEVRERKGERRRKVRMLGGGESMVECCVGGGVRRRCGSGERCCRGMSASSEPMRFLFITFRTIVYKRWWEVRGAGGVGVYVEEVMDFGVACGTTKSLELDLASGHQNHCQMF